MGGCPSLRGRRLFILEPLTKPGNVIHADERAADGEEGFVDIGSSFIACS
jgi:hypothetical protein